MQLLTVHLMLWLGVLFITSSSCMKEFGSSPGLVFAARRKLCIGFAGRKIFAGGRFGFAEFQPWMNAMSIGNRDIVIFFVADIVDSKMLAVLAGICFHDNHLTVIIK